MSVKVPALVQMREEEQVPARIIQEFPIPITNVQIQVLTTVVTAIVIIPGITVTMLLTGRPIDKAVITAIPNGYILVAAAAVKEATTVHTEVEGIAIPIPAMVAVIPVATAGAVTLAEVVSAAVIPVAVAAAADIQAEGAEEDNSNNKS